MKNIKRKSFMRKKNLLLAISALCFVNVVCKKTTSEKTQSLKTTIQKDTPKDKEFTVGKIPCAILKMETRLHLPGLEVPNTNDPEILKAINQSALLQTMTITDERGKISFDTKDSYLPLGTELRYNVTNKSYILIDPNKKQYWTFWGNEIGNILEGGPPLRKSNYSITIEDTKETETIVGVQAVRSNVVIGFDWEIKTKAKATLGKVKANIAIWHSNDKKLPLSWGKTMVDLVAIPFQDTKGQKIINQLKQKITFPIKWEMEWTNPDKKTEDHQPPKLVTIAKSLELKTIDKGELAAPPFEFTLATEPFSFTQTDGQTVPEKLLAKFPSEKELAPQKTPNAPNEEEELNK